MNLMLANTKSYNFYEKHGFKTSYTEDNEGNINPNFPVRWYFAYDLKSELPKKEISFKH